MTALMEEASCAGMRDYLRGGHSAYAASREAAWRLLGVLPHAPFLVQDAAWFAEHATTVLVRDHGVRQIVHLDCGYANVPGRNTHEIARASAARCRVVYTAADPLAAADARCLLADSDRVASVTTLLDTGVDDVLDHPAVTAHFDRARPVAVLCSSLEAVPDPGAALLRRLLAGGYLALCQPTVQETYLARHIDEEMGEALEGRWGRLRTPDQFASLLREADLVGGLDVVRAPRYLRSSYRPAGPPRAAVLGAIARIRPHGANRAAGTRTTPAGAGGSPGPAERRRP
ncbi:SAM-dependent methyltransferase [Streptomyces sp. BE20]|uniref:SAM-dependent methyltransferase n=1 Tax=Streptomyces sp. BE20 TaxID=3002525 RepID=UPI002E793CA3|nr:SAM-dependent methyltransferase [Streptomyces sp. BE20]MEE1823754.1 SAM-dependent methyltransferase [Streptomyces sp. BE20]